MKKEIGVLMLLSAVLLSGCGSDEPVKLIEASENEEVRLYAVNETDDEVHGVTVEINGSQKNFDWNILNTGTKPQVFYTDLTGDSKEEAVIIINTGRGTELDTFDIHVINAEDLSEIKVQNHEEIVANQIETHVSKNADDTLDITVKTKEKEDNFDSNIELAPNYNQDELAFGGVVIYQVEHQKIILSLGASVGISPQYVCSVNVTYKFDHAKNEFIADQIDFAPNENV
ncbi:hypothetical protein BVG16_31530 [Paenibacillus selenitireducens]|uniref:Uncharacterized protein n=1 Tax=Paenibacillus selenitireducens TaxID=1324314 RepID=A0A1T2WZA8_9BACL|nr:hypothetical protein [Paenibacillus selenitireducens]OPA72905.1 hypothetical protein BVG16_31530 [Paenibacillus selenitireducens]